jgi:hypothetical protein
VRAAGVEPGERLEVGHDDLRPPLVDGREPVPDRHGQLARRRGEVVAHGRPAADLAVVHRERGPEHLLHPRQALAQVGERAAGGHHADVVPGEQGLGDDLGARRVPQALAVDAVEDAQAHSRWLRPA